MNVSTNRSILDSVTIVSILRIYFTINLDFRNPDFIWPASEATEWTLIEVNVAIVCGMECPAPSHAITFMHSIINVNSSMSPLLKTNHDPRSSRPGP